MKESQRDRVPPRIHSAIHARGSAETKKIRVVECINHSHPSSPPRALIFLPPTHFRRSTTLSKSPRSEFDGVSSIFERRIKGEHDFVSQVRGRRRKKIKFASRPQQWHAAAILVQGSIWPPAAPLPRCLQGLQDLSGTLIQLFATKK